MDTWLIIHLLDGESHVWNLGDPTDDERAEFIMAARASVGFPPDDEWAQRPDLSSVIVTFGEPHHTLMARAHVGGVADLAKVDTADYKAVYAANVRRHQVETLAASLSGVDPAVLAEALAAVERNT